MNFNFSSADASNVEIPKNGILYVACTDNVTDDDCWPVYRLKIVNGIVQNCEEVKEGIYSVDTLLGMNITDLQKWLDFDSTGSHPETYHEIVLPIEE